MIFADKLKFVAAQAHARLPQLSDEDRVQLLEGLEILFGQISRPAEAEQCRRAIDAIRSSQAEQLTLGEMLS